MGRVQVRTLDGDEEVEVVHHGGHGQAVAGGKLPAHLLGVVVPVAERHGAGMCICTWGESTDEGGAVPPRTDTHTNTHTYTPGVPQPTHKTHPPIRRQVSASWSSFSSRETFQAAMNHTVKSKPRSQSPTTSLMVVRMVSSLSP